MHNPVTKIRKAVFPVGGLGTRFLPVTKAVPKEMLPVVDRPLLQYAVDEALAAGCEQMVFVTARGKNALEDYFDIAAELVTSLQERGKQAELKILGDTQLGPGEIAYVRQQSPLGLGHAVWCARHIVGDEPFAVILPDEFLWSPHTPCLKHMVDAYHQVGGNIVGVMEVPLEHTRRYGIIAPGARTDSLIEVKQLVEKPDPREAPSRLAVVGRYILQPEVIDILSHFKRGAGNEVQLTDAMAEIIGQQPFHAWNFAGARFDCGNKADYVMANISLALERDDIGPAVRDFIRNLHIT